MGHMLLGSEECCILGLSSTESEIFYWSPGGSCWYYSCSCKCIKIEIFELFSNFWISIQDIFSSFQSQGNIKSWAKPRCVKNYSHYFFIYIYIFFSRFFLLLRTIYLYPYFEDGVLCVSHLSFDSLNFWSSVPVCRLFLCFQADCSLVWKPSVQYIWTSVSWHFRLQSLFTCFLPIFFFV